MNDLIAKTAINICWANSEIKNRGLTINDYVNDKKIRNKTYSKHFNELKFTRKIICENKNFKLSRPRKQSSSSFKRFNNEENDINFNNQLDFVDNVLEIISGNENDIGFSKDNYDIVKNYFDNPHFDKNSDYNRSEHNIFYK